MLTTACILMILGFLIPSDATEWVNETPDPKVFIQVADEIPIMV